MPQYKQCSHSTKKNPTLTTDDDIPSRLYVVGKREAFVQLSSTHELNFISREIEERALNPSSKQGRLISNSHRPRTSLIEKGEQTEELGW